MGHGTLIEAQPALAIDEETLAGRVALVTGGTRGIGAAIARSLVRRGAVVAAGFSSDSMRADEFVRAVDPDGGRASVHQGNVGDPDDCARVVQEVIDHHGRLDILVNNAASRSIAPSRL